MCCAVFCVDWGSTCNLSRFTCNAIVTLLLTAIVTIPPKTLESQMWFDRKSFDKVCWFVTWSNKETPSYWWMLSILVVLHQLRKHAVYVSVRPGLRVSCWYARTLFVTVPSGNGFLLVSAKPECSQIWACTAISDKHSAFRCNCKQLVQLKQGSTCVPGASSCTLACVTTTGSLWKFIQHVPSQALSKSQTLFQYKFCKWFENSKGRGPQIGDRQQSKGA